MHLEKINKLILSPKEVKRFKQNKFALLGIYTIVLLILIAIFGVIISPDKSKDANTQNLAIKLNSPGFETNIIELGKLDTINFFSKNFQGHTSSLENIAIEDSFYYIHPFLYYKRIKSPFWSEMHYSEITNHKDTLNIKSNVFSHIKIKRFYLGTDGLGRDILSRLILGTRISLIVGFIAVIISLIIGTFMGALAGYYGGKMDKFIMWIINVFWAIPTILLAMALLLSIPSKSSTQFLIVFLAVGLTMWVDTARMVRGQFLQIKEMDFIEATRAFGFSDLRIIIKHIFPNTYTTLIVITSSNFATAILMESGLSYLGIGVQPPTPSWGSMMKEYYGLLGTDLSYLALFPGICIMIAVLAFYALGNGLRDAFDIKGQ